MSDTALEQSPRTYLRSLFTLLRPNQWVKNGFVLAPLLFTGKFTDHSAVGDAAFAAVLFCIASSAVYVVNDLVDVQADRKHPTKSKTRPLAAGTVSPLAAAVVLLPLNASLLAAAFVSPNVMAIIAAYLGLNLVYTFVLKNEPVIDIFIIAASFVLRVYAGATALSVTVSSWMFVTTLCLALYLAAIKRRQELSQNGCEGRKVLKHYSLSLVSRYAEMSATGALVFYSMFVMSTRPELIVTVPLVLFGLFRYWYVVEIQDGGASPTDSLLSDRQLQLTVVVWVLVCGWATLP
jgi:4-hydroxybenzoate polyprenyltransferase